ncbi:MAG: hypothetical protein C3F06_02370 [Candidatus Methanoperedenaceae archaeon]|nr:MAG: hypothetical protein C3F06_02370 [Candidatus Methanoperedenaceae archaeon]
MRTSNKRNQIAKANTNRKKNTFSPDELIGREVAFQILIPRKIGGRAKEYFESHIGKVKEVQKSVVVIEGSSGGIYNRPVDKISLLDRGDDILE